MAFANPSTISKDSTQGRAGEEMQILLDLANRTSATPQLSLSSSRHFEPTPPPPPQPPPPLSQEQRQRQQQRRQLEQQLLLQHEQQLHQQLRQQEQLLLERKIREQELLPPPPRDAPPTPLHELLKPLPRLKEEKAEDDSSSQDSDNDIASAPFLSGTRLSYQVAGARDEDVPVPPKDWKPTWSSSFETATRLENIGLGSSLTTATRETNAEPVAHKIFYDYGTNTRANNDGPRPQDHKTLPNVAPDSEMIQIEPQTVSQKTIDSLSYKVK
jgi:hypothetical protein